MDLKEKLKTTAKQNFKKHHNQPTNSQTRPPTIKKPQKTPNFTTAGIFSINTKEWRNSNYNGENFKNIESW